MTHKLWGGLVATCLVGIAGAPVAQETPVQSLVLRAVTVTCKLEESITFYRDIMGQEVMLDEPTGRSFKYLGIDENTQVRFVIMRGSAVYPGGRRRDHRRPDRFSGNHGAR